MLIIAAVIFIVSAGEDVSAQGPQKLDEACIRELETATKRCKETMMDESGVKQLSPDCRRQIEAKKWPQPDTKCGREMQAAGQAIMSRMIECRNKNISARCRKYFDTVSRNLQEKTKRCAAEKRRISSICGKGKKASEKCYEKHRVKLEAACGK